MTHARVGGELMRPSLDERRVRARSMAYLAATAGTLMLLTHVLPHRGAHEPGVLAIAGAAYASAVVAFTVRSLSGRGFDAIVAFAAVMISAAVVLGGPVAAAYELFLVWLTLLVFYFRPWAEAARLLVFIVVAYAVALLVRSAPGDATRPAVLVGTLLVTAAFVGLLKSRVDRLVLELSDAARHDPVTGLLNRRGFDEAYGRELDRARHNGRPLSLLVADLDHLKEINDRLGHQAGDAALERVGAAITAVARRVDNAARSGGDEFAVLLPETDAQGALVMAERLCSGREAGLGGPTPLTLSVGCATYADDGRDEEALVRDADERRVCRQAPGGRPRRQPLADGPLTRTGAVRAILPEERAR